MPTDRTHAKDIAVQREKCFLVRLLTPEDAVAGEDPLDEIAELLDTAGGEEVGRLVQKRDRPHPRTYLHKGKLAELVEAVHESGAETVLVDDDLSPPQLSAIENACSRKVIDRNELILDIFQAHARTHQAKLQVQLAQLQYELPRLARKWTHLERLGGGIGTRGPGESQIETDRRLLRNKISQLRNELDALEERKVREVSARGPVFAACLVGYTNAGKSSLLNRVTGAGAFVENRLFATLDTLTRRVDPPAGAGGGAAGGAFLLSDTVGFIRRLPHHLVASFHATLEEAAQANLLLHVVDAADPFAAEYIASVDGTLAELGLDNLPRAHVLNKIDRLTNAADNAGVNANAVDTPDMSDASGDASGNPGGPDAPDAPEVADVPDAPAWARLAETLPPPVFAVSAKTGEGVEALVDYIRGLARARARVHTIRFPASDGRRFALLNQYGRVEETTYEDADCVVQVSLDETTLARLKALPGEMSVH